MKIPWLLTGRSAGWPGPRWIARGLVWYGEGILKRGRFVESAYGEDY